MCVRVFLLISSKSLMWVIKEKWQWDGKYFREKIIPIIVDFINNPDNVPKPDNAWLVHDLAPGWKANSIQQLLEKQSFNIKAKGFGR